MMMRLLNDTTNEEEEKSVWNESRIEEGLSGKSPRRAPPPKSY